MTATLAEPVARLLAQSKAVGRTGKLVGGNSLSSVNNLLVLQAVMDAQRPARTLEIGLARGASAVLAAASHRSFGASGVHVAIDPFQDTVWDDCGALAIEAEGLSAHFNLVRDFSRAALPEMMKDGLQFDLIYIDGSHLFEDVFIDALFSARLLAQGGVVLFDDSSDRHVQKVVSFVRSNMRHVLEEIDLEQFRSFPDAMSRLRYRLARLMNRVQLTGFRRTGDADRAWNAPLARF